MKFEDEPVPGFQLPILPGHSSPGRFERVLRAGRFAVTAEIAPPDSADPNEVYLRARIFDGYVDAINATDGSGANCHMSSVGVCSLLTREGYSTIMQVSCRDRTLEADLHVSRERRLGIAQAVEDGARGADNDARGTGLQLRNAALAKGTTDIELFGAAL